MVKSISIVRLSDTLPLVASVDDEQSETDLVEEKKQCKLLTKKLNINSEPNASVEGHRYNIHYSIRDGICYLCICDKSYPRKLAFSFLEQLIKEFSVHSVDALKPGIRPYAFIRFETDMKRLQREFSSNLDKLQSDLQDVTRIMSKNIEDLLYRGDSLDRMSDLSSTLRDESQKYRRTARQVNLEALWKQYGPFATIILIFLLFLYFRYLW